MKLDYLNHKTYDAQDRPAKLALEARESVDRILGAEDQFNYIRAKAIAQQGKPELVKKNQENAEKIFLEAQIQITSSYGENHPLVAKYN